MLTYLLDRLPESMYHLILRLMGFDIETFHEWLEGFCACGAFNDIDELEKALIQ